VGSNTVSDPADIGEVLAEIDGTCERIGFEAGPLSQWLYNRLASAGLAITGSHVWTYMDPA